MKFLICGLGSIGQRHVRNLRKILPKCEIIAYRSTQKDITDFENSYHIKSTSSLDEALSYKPDAVFITNPTSLHVPFAIKFAENGLDLFIEKPLSHSWEGVEKLEKIITKKKLIVTVGFMMRYNPGIMKIKKLLEKKVIGNIISAQIINAEYLPSWHPWENYQESYSARKDLGGGVILTFTHELDYASWFFGRIESVFCTTNKSKILKTDVEDSADILLSYKSGVKVSIHLDYLGQPPIRTVSIIGEKGRIFWDYYQSKVKWYNSKKNKWQTYLYRFDRNDMFLKEIEDFLKCLKTRNTPINSLSLAKENLRIALGAKESVKKRKEIIL